MEMRTKFASNQFILLIAFILTGIIGRYLLFGLGFQPFPNFEIIMVLTFLAVLFLHPTIAFLVPLLSMIGSDILIGNPIFMGHQMNQIVLFTYSGFLLIALINVFYRQKIRASIGSLRLRSFGLVAGFGIGFVLLYDVWTNFGWWYLIYPHTIETLGLVYTAGIPFMLYHLLSGVTTFLVVAYPIIYLIEHKSSVETVDIPRIQKLPVAITTCCLILLSFTGTGWW